MSLRYEQYRSLKITREFLYELLFTKTRPKTVKDLRAKAIRCLKHYPHLEESGKPIFSKDNFTED